MFVTGPDVVKAVTHEEVTKEDLGGAYTHTSQSGVAHFMNDTEEETLTSIRELLSFLPSTIWKMCLFVLATTIYGGRGVAAQQVIPDDPNIPYDIKDIIEPVVDDHYFLGVMPSFAKCGDGVCPHGWAFRGYCCQPAGLLCRGAGY